MYVYLIGLVYHFGYLIGLIPYIIFGYLIGLIPYIIFGYLIGLIPYTILSI